MGSQRRPSHARIERGLQAESDLIRDAVQLVASGASPRVTVAGLRFGDQLLERARAMADAGHLRLVPRWSADESGVDLVIERIDGTDQP
jgi:hypothetical protein